MQPVLRIEEIDKNAGRAGIENYGHFQGRITTRGRTVTGNRKAFIVTWDDWALEENAGVGRYAVTATTFRSLRNYSHLDQGRRAAALVDIQSLCG